MYTQTRVCGPTQLKTLSRKQLPRPLIKIVLIFMSWKNKSKRLIWIIKQQSAPWEPNPALSLHLQMYVSNFQQAPSHHHCCPGPQLQLCSFLIFFYQQWILWLCVMWNRPLTVMNPQKIPPTLYLCSIFRLTVLFLWPRYSALIILFPAAGNCLQLKRKRTVNIGLTFIW